MYKVILCTPCAAVECFFKTCGTNSHCETSATLTSQATVCVCNDGFKEDQGSNSCVGEAAFCVDQEQACYYSNVTTNAPVRGTRIS